MYHKLFSPIRIRGLELKNRVVFPAACTHMAAEDGSVTDQLIAYHEARAKGGSGLNILEATNVQKSTAAPGFPGIYSDKFLPNLNRLADAVHAVGGRCCVQLWQGGLAAALQGGKEYVVPSDYPTASRVLKAATKEEIADAVKAFGDAAERAVKAGFDCVEFHAAHNYSPHMFLSKAFNRREDEYGGSLENRARYALECIRAIRERVPEDFPVFMRVNSKDDDLENGLTRDDIVKFCLMAKECGVDVINVSRGNIVSAAVQYEVPSIDLPKAFNIEDIAYIKEKTGMITIATGRINDPELAEEILKKDLADLLVIGRAQICDPEFCNKAMADKAEDIVKCVACNQGCYDRLTNWATYPHISCLRNPAVGFEKEYELKKTENPKTVAVIGGGMGGMEAAMILKQRGHHPILFEKSGELGGQFKLAGLAPRKQEMREAAISRSEQLQRAGVEIRLNTLADEMVLNEIKPDVIVNAAGGTPIILSVPGANGSNVYAGFDVLKGETVLDGKRTVVIGGGLVGLEVAEYLSEHGCDVTVVEMQDVIGKDIGHGRKTSVMCNLKAHNIKFVTNTACTAITEKGVQGKCGDEIITVEGEAVVVAVGSRSNNTQWLTDYCAKKEIALYTIGDAKKTRRAIDAIHEAWEVARSI